MRALALVALLAGCQVTPSPPAREPAPPDPPGKTCADAAAHVAELGGCGQEVATFEERCERAQAAELAAHVVFPVGCMATAESCQTWKACR